MKKPIICILFTLPLYLSVQSIDYSTLNLIFEDEFNYINKQDMKKVWLLNASQKSVPIQVNGLPQGNYILELQGDNTYLKSEHLMVY